MKTIAILSRKGGAGKTTLAVHLAVAALAEGKTAALIDLDPQASATSWKDSRSDEAPAVISAQAARLPHLLETARESGADLVIIDTAPHLEATALAAARGADLVLIPCRPAILDLRAIGSTVDVAQLAKAPVCVVLNAVPSRGYLSDEARTAIGQYSVPVAPVELGHRVAFVHALTIGQTVTEYEPKGKAASEIQQLYMYTCQHVGM